MRSKLTIIFLLLVLIGSNVYWFVATLDQGVTQVYTESSLEQAQKQYKQTAILSNLELNGLSSEEALKRIGKDVYGLEPFVKEGCIWAGQVCLRLENGHVTGINHDAL